jgi:hypothetical protein
MARRQEVNMVREPIPGENYTGADKLHILLHENAITVSMYRKGELMEGPDGGAGLAQLCGDSRTAIASYYLLIQRMRKYGFDVVR